MIRKSPSKIDAESICVRIKPDRHSLKH